MTEESQSRPLGAFQGPGAAASLNGNHSHPADETLASEVLRESALTLRAVESIENQLELVQVELALLVGIALITLAFLIVNRRGEA